MFLKCKIGGNQQLFFEGNLADSLTSNNPIKDQ
jgi:hypothetical protein